MKLSVITATYNSEKTIRKTINSILNQTVNDIEYIIIDGKSNDSTVQIIKEYEQDFNKANISFKWISEKDSGIYDAWNKGLRLSTGEWVSFLGSDDWYVENAVEYYQKTILNTASKLDLVYSNVNLIRNNKVLKNINGTWKWKVFKKYMNIAHVGAFHNKIYFETYGYFNDSYKIAGDYELLLRAKKELKTMKIEFNSAFMTDGGVSNDNVILAFKETLRAKRDTANIPYIVCLYDFMIAWLKNKYRRNFQWVK
ncbi:glycosyltransferase [Winogradskyella echinorum]|uniref:Glycosyltransferase n=1 Tax=Winogradskyella echinorum TaxID=538189 RepID=A0ABR6XZ28_9FLAO|nr:glycosyltransferase family 2 protein [Winogradskyella echinorum]MBC3845738.1 glycosyltransferase [Winogradskyella echinorum]MBC5750086.1 glycosyltransferase [Winogradskyella echinorum]